MKLLVVLAVLAVAFARPDDGFYDTKYESFDVKELISNIRLLKAYVQCFQSKGKCTPEGTDIKKWIPEALDSECAKCTEKQKALVAEVLKAIMELLPAEWEELVKIYNSNGQSLEILAAFINKYAPK